LDDDFKIDNHLIIDNIEDLELEEVFQNYQSKYKGDSSIKIIISTYSLVLIGNHILIDGYSSSIFMRNFLCSYYGELQSKNINSFLAHAEREKKYLKSSSYRNTLDYWVAEFQSFAGKVTFHSLMNSNTNQFIPKSDLKIVNFCFTGSSYESIIVLSKQYGVSKYIFLLATFMMILSQILDNKSFIIGIFSNGRKQADEYNTMGSFSNPVPLIIDRDDLVNRSTIIHVIYRRMAEISKYDIVRLDDIIKEVKNRFNKDIDCIFNITFNYISFKMSMNKEYSQDIQKITIYENLKLSYELNIIIYEYIDQFEIEIQYNDLVITECIVDNIQKMFRESLNSE
jgi:hypothetical protein